MLNLSFTFVLSAISSDYVRVHAVFSVQTKHFLYLPMGPLHRLNRHKLHSGGTIGQLQKKEGTFTKIKIKIFEFGLSLYH